MALVDDIIDVSQLETDALVLRRSPVALDGLLRAIVAERAEAPGGRSVRLEVARWAAPRRRGCHAHPAGGGEPRPERREARGPRGHHRDPGAPARPRDRRHDDQSTMGGGSPPRIATTSSSASSGAPGRVDGQVPGSGLGLYLCRRIVEAHGGWIRLDATTRGTSVSVGLPVALHRRGSCATQPRRPREERPRRSDRGQRRADPRRRGRAGVRGAHRALAGAPRLAARDRPGRRPRPARDRPSGRRT